MKKIVRNLAVVLTLSMCVTCINPVADAGVYAAAKKTTESKQKTKKKIKLNKKKVTIRANKTVKLKLKNAKAKKVKWSSSNKKVATVTKKGLVRALKKGKTIITAKYKGKKYKCKIKVKKAKNVKRAEQTEEINDKKEEEKKSENPEDTGKKEPPSVSAEDVNGSTLLQSIYLVDKLYDEKNILVSPASLNMVLGMATNGATELAKKELETYLGNSTEQYNQYVSALMKRLENDSMLTIANGVWYRENAEINSSFSDALTNSYEAMLKKSPLDSTTVEEINQWADDNTKGMIKKVIEKIPVNAAAVLTNALLFEGEWTVPFLGDNTYEEDFSKADGSKVKVEMMHSTEHIYYENEYATGFEKTYGKNKEYSFIAILPKEEGEFELSNLDIKNFLDTKTNEYKVKISMPKFTYDWNAILNPVLKTTNIKLIFQPEANPLGNMLQIEDNIYVSDVFQVCKIIVDEEGTKAAAITGIISETTAMPGIVPNIKRVNLNRPFGYIIRDNSTNEILFTGKVVDPTQK